MNKLKMERVVGDSLYVGGLKITLESVCSSGVRLKLRIKRSEEKVSIPRGKKLVVYNDMSHNMANVPFSLAKKEDFYCIFGCLYWEYQRATFGISTVRKIWKEEWMKPKGSLYPDNYQFLDR